MDVLTTSQLNFKDIIKYPDLSIKSGITTFITGESGAGKSTLFRLFNNTVSPTSGTLTYKGKNIEEYDPIQLRQEILFVGQNVFLFEETIQENFVRFFSYRDTKAPTNEEMKFYLHLCLIDFPLDTSCITLSQGEKQRVYLAIHLSLGFEVLLLDEPTSALDNTNSDKLLSNIIELCNSQHKTLLVITHDHILIQDKADVVYELKSQHKT